MTGIKPDTRGLKRFHWSVLALFILFLIFGTAITLWNVQQEDLSIRRSLLTEVRVAHTGIDTGQVTRLTGTTADLASPIYQSVKKEMTDIRDDDAKIRFTYLIGRRSDGSHFIFVDSEDPASEQYSPPGDNYTEIPQPVTELFLSGREITLGPYTDRWGTWVSGYVPLTDARTGQIVAILGMDIDAAVWGQQIVRSSLLPITGMLVILLIVLVFVFTQQRNEQSRRRIEASEQAMRLSEERHRMLLASLPNYVVVYSGKKILYANPALLGRFGMSEEEISRVSLLDFVASESKAVINERIRRSNDGEASDPCEIVVITPAAERRVLYLQPFPQNITYNGNLATVVVMTDITELKNAEREIKEHELFLQRLIDTIVNPIFYKDKSGRYLGCNKAFEEYLGLPKEQIIGKDVFDVTPKELAGIFHAEDQELISNPGSRSYESQIRYADGSLHDVIINKATYYNADGRPEGIVGVIIDITERKQAELALKKSENQLGLAIEGSGVGLWDWKVQTGETEFNTRWVEMLGYTLDDLAPLSIETWIRLTHPDDLARSNSVLQRHFAHEIPVYECEVRMKHKDGHWVWILDRGKVTEWGEDGTPVRATGTHLDITDRKQAEEALRKANRQLNLLGSVTRHDINNKIMVVLGYIGIAERKSNEKDTAAFLEKIKGVMTIIQSQIAFTKVYQDLGTHEPQWQNLDLIIQILQLPETITLTADVQEIWVYADPMLEKVFSNLLDNSIRHGGHVTEIRVFSRLSEDGLLITWEDNGVGIPVEEKERIFEYGFGKNTGLGMFLSREILHLTNIAIHEIGEPGTGARFVMAVPKGVFRFS